MVGNAEKEKLKKGKLKNDEGNVRVKGAAQAK